MKFNHSKLLGKIKEFGMTQADLASSIGINKGTLSAKLNSQYCFTSDEMVAICEVLNVPIKEIPQYFFTLLVQKR